jgi:hypothetical protein
MRRNNITIDRAAYYTTEMHYSNEVAMPDAAQFGLRAGYRSARLIAEALLYNFNTLGGFDISKNNMPFPSNKMNSTTAGLNLKYEFKKLKGLSLIGGGNYTIAGPQCGTKHGLLRRCFLCRKLQQKLTAQLHYMKKIFSAIGLFSILIFSCSKNIDVTNDFAALAPSKNDLDAGTWKPILLAAPDEFPVAAPVAANTPGYAAEVNEIKGWQAGLTATQRESIKYWSAGAVLRWNEIMRELVAKHNIPPYQNQDGSYPFPSAANPFAYPTFPFSNPPYAARAYGYVSAAQYDALVAAYHYKKLYNRAAPYTIEGVQALVPKTDLPSYPSEDAVVIGVTVELLKLLFPTDQAFIQQKAEEHKRCRIMAGANVRSDMEAGEALGKAVAQKFTARARTDKAGAAIGTAVQWAEFEAKTAATGEMAWISQESPKRPPMLPLFGNVKTFLFDSATLIAIRPPAPPSTHSEQFKKD